MNIFSVYHFNLLIGHYQFNILMYFSRGIDHYTQVAWADIDSIGCARIVFKENDLRIVHFVCNYAGKNASSNKPNTTVYKIGEPCSQCPGELKCNSKKWPGLCGNDSNELDKKRNYRQFAQNSFPNQEYYQQGSIPNQYPEQFAYNQPEIGYADSKLQYENNLPGPDSAGYRPNQNTILESNQNMPQYFQNVPPHENNLYPPDINNQQMYPNPNREVPVQKNARFPNAQQPNNNFRNPINQNYEQLGQQIPDNQLRFPNQNQPQNMDMAFANPNGPFNVEGPPRRQYQYPNLVQQPGGIQQNVVHQPGLNMPQNLQQNSLGSFGNQTLSNQHPQNNAMNPAEAVNFPKPNAIPQSTGDLFLEYYRNLPTTTMASKIDLLVASHVSNTKPTAIVRSTAARTTSLNKVIKPGPKHGRSSKDSLGYNLDDELEQQQYLRQRSAPKSYDSLDALEQVEDYKMGNK